ncbi:hypothetical protein AGLY_005243 [Aphis glycines]|uniref:Uncharacterized protein n=1 Tax=Aphis glycines TaxID=307491 RepID=A0A6G0TWC1_APHGL|nr:hypothetical protein AGLY_005243 [Aphis glycines]
MTNPNKVISGVELLNVYYATIKRKNPECVIGIGLLLLRYRLVRMALNLGIAGSGPTSGATMSNTPILPTNKSKYTHYLLIYGVEDKSLSLRYFIPLTLSFGENFNHICGCCDILSMWPFSYVWEDEDPDPTPNTVVREPMFEVWVHVYKKERKYVNLSDRGTEIQSKSWMENCMSKLRPRTPPVNKEYI